MSSVASLAYVASTLIAHTPQNGFVKADHYYARAAQTRALKENSLAAFIDMNERASAYESIAASLQHMARVDRTVISSQFEDIRKRHAKTIERYQTTWKKEKALNALASRVEDGFASFTEIVTLEEKLLAFAAGHQLTAASSEDDSGCAGEHPGTGNAVEGQPRKHRKKRSNLPTTSSNDSTQVMATGRSFIEGAGKGQGRRARRKGKASGSPNSAGDGLESSCSTTRTGSVGDLASHAGGTELNISHDRAVEEFESRVEDVRGSKMVPDTKNHRKRKRRESTQNSTWPGLPSTSSTTMLQSGEGGGEGDL